MRPLILAAILAAAAIGFMGGGVSADGNGSPEDCEGGPSITGDPEASYDAGDGNIVEGVCIKSGQLHTDVLEDGTYEDGCYEVDGVGTQEVTVTRVGDESPDCQAISHVDLILGSCGAPCDPPPCEEECEPDPCDVQDPGPECTPDPCDDPEPPAECDPIIEVCVNGEILEFPESQAPEDTGDCEITICIDGQFVTVPSGTAATNDCDPVRLCVDGQSITVTEYAAQFLDGDPGSCTPSEEPPPTTTEEEPAPEEPIEEVQGVVQEVAPTEEVAALPAAGYGDTSSSNLLWIAILGTMLTGLSGTTVMLLRQRR
jgi:hypothetical protein